MALPVLIIGGPTASGKSRFALDLARHLGGEIINGDSMQMYRHLPVLTAQPPPCPDIPHHLYGILGNADIASMASWYQRACQVIADIQSRGKRPIVVGGTGLYLHALTRGVSAVPDISPLHRQEARHLSYTLPSDDFFELVSQEDPKIRGVLHPQDTQRLARALEVVRSTGISLLDYQGKASKLLDFSYHYFVLLPPRPHLYQCINNRFTEMIEQGAVREVESLLQENINPASPVLKAIGVPELTAFLQGKISLAEAVALAQQSSRRYAKRQITWFSRQAPEARILLAPSDIDILELSLKLR